MTKLKDAELRGLHSSIRISWGCSLSLFYSFALLPRISALSSNQFKDSMGHYLYTAKYRIVTPGVNQRILITVSARYCGLPRTTLYFCRAFNMPKTKSGQVQGPRVPSADYDYTTWTVTRIRQELEKYDIWPGSWIKKSGLVSLLKSAMKQHDDRDGAPSAALRGRARSKRACAANEEAEEVEASPGVRNKSPSVPQNLGFGMAEFAATIAKLQTSVSLLNATLLQASAAQPRDVTSDTGDGLRDSHLVALRPRPDAHVVQDSGPVSHVMLNPSHQPPSGPDVPTGGSPVDPEWQQSSANADHQEKWSTWMRPNLQALSL